MVTPITASVPPYPYPIRIIGMLEINVPKIGINPSINTIRESVNIYGNPEPHRLIPITESHMAVNIAFTNAIIDCALKMSPKPLAIFIAMI